MIMAIPQTAHVFRTQVKLMKSGSVVKCIPTFRVIRVEFRRIRFVFRSVRFAFKAISVVFRAVKFFCKYCRAGMGSG